MKRMIENMTGSYTSTAKVVDGTLILSLPDAVIPTVWRLDLGQVRASALEVRPDEENKTFLLALKTPKGDVHDIAPFDTKNKAVSALMAVSHAMENAHGQIKPMVFSANDEPHEAAKHASPRLPALYKNPYSSKNNGKIAAGVVAIALIFAMIFVLQNISPTTYVPNQNRPLNQTTAGANLSNDMPGGVPVSADDFLNRR
jgi:hypothetical protein